MKLTVWLLTSLFVISCTNDSTIKRIDGTEISRAELNRKIEALMDSTDVTGLAVAIFNDNKAVYKKAFGYANYESKDSLQTDHVFHAASLSKAVFGYLVAGLVQEGVIDLDTPLQNYLDKPIPELEFEKEWRGFANLAGDERFKQITARMCLSHTTGFPNWRWMDKNNDIFREGKIRFLFDPGTRFYYSGEGMMLLQYVIEHITGKGLEELARERVFEPLEMDMTSYVWQDRFEGNYANGHTAAHEVIPRDIQDEAGAAGSMETTLDDYSNFLNHILRRASSKSNVTDLMFEPSVRIHSKTQFGYQAWEETDENDDIELSYGLGWGLLQSPYGYGALKEGSDHGFHHYSILFPEKKIGVLILSNSDNAESIFKELLELTIADTFTPWRWERYIPYDYEGQ